MTAAVCHRCGESWPDGDPALRVPCPVCRAGAGSRCRRPSGHECNVHGARDQLAMDRGLLRPCTALSWDGRHSAARDAVPPRPALACQPMPGALAV